MLCYAMLCCDALCCVVVLCLTNADDMMRLSGRSDVSRSKTASSPSDEVIIVQSPSRPQSSGNKSRKGSSNDIFMNKSGSGLRTSEYYVNGN
jgi:hypothetical protein